MASQPPATVPSPPDLFIGLVTHQGSRFADSASVDGLGATIARILSARGLAVIWSVCDEDRWTPEILDIDRAEVARGIDAELDVEGRWRSYIAGRPLSMTERATLLARRIWRRTTLAPPGRRALRGDDAGFRATRRLANIELAHLEVMREAAASGAAWALILEDDAASAEPTAFAEELGTFLQAHENTRQPLMVSLSESFTPAQLGIEHLLVPLTRGEGNDQDQANTPPNWHLWAAKRPVTNTVCATLYRRNFVVSLVDTLETISLAPVVPIDFKLNEALMRVAPTMQSGDCWIAHPAPLAQRSGVPQVRG